MNGKLTIKELEEYRATLPADGPESDLVTKLMELAAEKSKPAMCGQVAVFNFTDEDVTEGKRYTINNVLPEPERGEGYYSVSVIGVDCLFGMYPGENVVRKAYPYRPDSAVMGEILPADEASTAEYKEWEAKQPVVTAGYPKAGDIVKFLRDWSEDGIIADHTYKVGSLTAHPLKPTEKGITIIDDDGNELMRVRVFDNEMCVREANSQHSTVTALIIPC